MHFNFRILVRQPRRSKVRFAPFFYAEKHPPASLLLLFRKKARSARLLACKRAYGGSHRYRLFARAPTAQISLWFGIAAKSPIIPGFFCVRKRFF